MAFVTRESLDQHISISPSGKTAPRTCLTASNTQQLGNLAPQGLPFFCSFRDERKKKGFLNHSAVGINGWRGLW